MLQLRPSMYILLFGTTAVVAVLASMILWRRNDTSKLSPQNWPSDLDYERTVLMTKSYLQSLGWEILEGWMWCNAPVRARKDKTYLNLVIHHADRLSLQATLQDTLEVTRQQPKVIGILTSEKLNSDMLANLGNTGTFIINPNELVAVSDIIEETTRNSLQIIASSRVEPTAEDAFLDQTTEQILSADQEAISRPDEHRQASLQVIEHSNVDDPTARVDFQAPSEMPFRGLVGSVSKTAIWGWAYSDRNPAEHLSISVYNEAKLIAEGRADLLRLDLVTSKIGDGDHAFMIEVTLDLENLNINALHVTASDATGKTQQLRMSTTAVSRTGRAA